MKRTTSQWRGVSSGMPFSRAICSASVSSHCFASTRKPSASTAGAIVVMDPPFGNRQRPSGQQRVPVEPFETELAEVVQPRLGEQRQRPEAARLRLDVVVEVDQQRLLEPGLDEAARSSVELADQLLAFEETRDVLGEDLAFEVRHRAGLRRWYIGCVTDREHVVLRERLERVLVRRDEPERVAEARRALDVRGAAVHRNCDEEVELELAAVERDELAVRAVHFAGVELGLELDAFLLEHVGEVL